MRRYRKQRRQGLRSVRILLDETDIDALIRMRLLKEDQPQDVEALQTAVLGLVACCGPSCGRHAQLISLP
jgi:hypothetical protein